MQLSGTASHEQQIGPSRLQVGDPESVGKVSVLYRIPMAIVAGILDGVLATAMNDEIDRGPVDALAASHVVRRSLTRTALINAAALAHNAGMLIFLHSL